VRDIRGLMPGRSIAPSNDRMSYRDDHDAAIARADALSHELGQSEAKRERLESDRKRLETEIDRLHLRAALPRTPRLRPFLVAVLMVVAAIVLEPYGHLHHEHGRYTDPKPTPATPTPTPATTTTTRRATLAPTVPASRSAAPVRLRGADPQSVDGVLACAVRTQRATDAIATLTDLRSLRASCRTTIEYVARHGTISVEGRELLTRWLALEDRLAPSLAAYNVYILRDPGGTRYRAPAALREEFFAILRDRSAVLATLPSSLKPG
jgi:hypothetical protein